MSATVDYLNWSLSGKGWPFFPSLYHLPCGQVIIRNVNLSYNGESGYEFFKCEECELIIKEEVWNHLRKTFKLMLPK